MSSGVTPTRLRVKVTLHLELIMVHDLSSERFVAYGQAYTQCQLPAHRRLGVTTPLQHLQVCGSQLICLSSSLGAILAQVFTSGAKATRRCG